MKKLLLIIFALFCTIANAQYRYPIAMYGAGTMPTNEDGKVVFSRVVHVGDASKDEIYQAARLFMVDLFSQPNRTIAIDDEEHGIIMAKGLSVETTNNGFVDCTRDIKFTIKIQVREGRYKIEIYDLIGEFYYKGTFSSETAENCTDDACLNSKGVIRPNGKAVWRRMMQNCAYDLIANAVEKIKPITNKDQDDW